MVLPGFHDFPPNQNLWKLACHCQEAARKRKKEMKDEMLKQSLVRDGIVLKWVLNKIFFNLFMATRINS
jgi:hypothetical protein